MKHAIDERSHRNLEGVHPHLIMWFTWAHELVEETGIRIMCIEGTRSMERQLQLYNNGASKTLNSRHIPKETPGGAVLAHALDIVPVVDGKVSWAWPHFHVIAPIMKDAACQLFIPIEWGGDWKSFKDGPHWQLPWKQYPVK